MKKTRTKKCYYGYDTDISQVAHQVSTVYSTVDTVHSTVHTVYSTTVHTKSDETWRAVEAGQPERDTYNFTARLGGGRAGMGGGEGEDPCNDERSRGRGLSTMQKKKGTNKKTSTGTAR